MSDQTDAARALAVLDRLWAKYPEADITMWSVFRGKGVHISIFSLEPNLTAGVDGPTPAAALLALGARLEGQDCPERDEGGAEDV